MFTGRAVLIGAFPDLTENSWCRKALGSGKTKPLQPGSLAERATGASFAIKLFKMG